MIVISITDEQGVLLEQFFTDESHKDVKYVIENGLAVYESKAELEKANEEDPG